MTRPKNVLWITTDHMRWDNIAACGAPWMHTPNLDRLVARGVTLRQCHNQNPLCMPSRASFMSGLYPQQTQVTANGHTLPPDFPLTPGRLFGAGGYTTVQIGKLHFQPHEDLDLDPRARHDYGFDVLCLSEESGCYDDAYMTWLHTEHPELVDVFRVPRPTSPERVAERSGRVLDAPWQASHSGWVADAADRWLAGRAARGGQFVHLGFYAPHPPLNPTREMFEPYDGAELPPPRIAPEEWTDKPEPLRSMLRRRADLTPEVLDQYRRHFFAMVTGVDLAVGRALTRLEAEAALDDTLIVFTADHGDMCGDHGLILKGPHFYDQVTHVPCVLHWPNGLGAAGRAVDGLAEMVDLMPTLLELCGLPVPEAMAGRSMAAALRDGRPPEPREDVYGYHHGEIAMVRTDSHKLVRFGAAGGEVLYDVAADAPEVVNHAEDPAYGDVLDELRERLLRRTMEACRSPLRRTYRF